MIVLTPEQILKAIIKGAYITTENYFKATDYIANNIEFFNTLINEAIAVGKKTIEVNIPELEAIIY